jgi:hypothetical protein
MTKLRPHCSSLDRIITCPGSILPADGPREGSGPDATAGRAKHEALSYIPRGLDPPTAEIAAKYGVAKDDIDMAVASGQKAWVVYGPYFPDAEVERAVECRQCLGTADVVSVVRGDDGGLLAIRICDWKTGHGSDYHPRQLQGYALCLVVEHGWPANGVSIVEIHTVTHQARTINLTQIELDAFAVVLSEIAWQAKGGDPSKLDYLAGAHCRWCPHRAGCGTRERWLRESTTALVAVEHGLPVTRETLGRLYLQSREVRRALDQFDTAVGAALQEGPLDLPDGRRVELTSQPREKINLTLAYPVLVELGLVDCGEDEEALKGDLPKSRLNDLLKLRAPRGGKARLYRQVMDALEAAGAVREVPYYQRKITDSKGDTE